MPNTKYRLFLAMTVMQLGWVGCGDTKSITETELQLIGNHSEALFAFAYQGSINFGEVRKNDLSKGDFGHLYAFEAKANQTITFVLEWRDLESAGLGADLWIRDGWFQILARDNSSSSNQAHVEVTFDKDGTYYIHIAHKYWGWFKTYPYLLGVEPDLCSQLVIDEHPDDQFSEWDFYFVQNYPSGSQEDAWDYFPEGPDPADCSVGMRAVRIGTCNNIIDDTCDSNDPKVCGATMIGGDVFNDACEFRTTLHVEAGAKFSAAGGYAEYPSCTDELDIEEN